MTTATVPTPRVPGRLRRRIRVIGWAALTALALAVVVFFVWANTPRVVERDAMAAVYANPALSVTDTPTAVVLVPRNGAAPVPASGTGLLFIPGARVDPYAYLPTLAGTVEQTGLTVVVAKPRLNLAILDPRPLTDFTDAAPGIDRWYVGGHSLGGVKACSFASDPKLAGLVLFGSFCASAPDNPGLRVLSIGGSADGLSTPEKIADAAHLLPADARFVQIDGANHASFGRYGVEDGDGVATISAEDAAAEITGALVGFLDDTP